MVAEGYLGLGFGPFEFECDGPRSEIGFGNGLEFWPIGTIAMVVSTMIVAQIQGFDMLIHDGEIGGGFYPIPEVIILNHNGVSGGDDIPNPRSDECTGGADLTTLGS